MSNRAWVTLATNDSYGLGALVLAHSLRRASSAYPAVVLITPSVTDAMKDRLRAVFAEVVIVDVLDSRDAAHLALLQRPELGITFTKIHCWNLTQYEKCVFLDADTLVVQNCDELFEREELSAAPDVGWPDCFNSGVFVYSPSADTFSKLITFASERGSFDGGDQGLLNSYFSDWAHGDINKHLPFLYNVTSAAFYSYIPALKHYGQNLKIIHFIGAIKPWLQQYNWESRSVEAPEHLHGFLQLWWDLFVAQVHTQLDTSMTGVAGNLARIVPGAPLQREAADELARRQGWEAGNIDYMGADSFDNIWAKISQTLSQPPTSVEQPPPPGAQSSPTEQQPPQPDTKLEQPSEPIAPAVKETEKESLSETTVEKVDVEESSQTPASLETPAAAATEAAPSQIEPEPSTPANEAIEPESVPVPAEVAADIAASESVPVDEKPEAIQEIPVTAVEALKIAESPKGVESAGATVPEPVAVPPTTVLKQDTAEPESVPVVAETATIELETAVAATEPAASITDAAPIVPEAAAVPQVTETKSETTSDSPPLANTPSKEEIPKAPAAKSTEEAAQETRL